MVTSKIKKDPDWYQSVIKRAKKHKKRLELEYEWQELRNTINTAGLYTDIESDSPKQVEQSHTSSGYVNWPWAFKESFIPAVYTRNPEIYVYPKRSVDEPNAKYVQDNINATLREIGFAREVKRSLLDTLVFGHGWIKLGWFTSFGQLPKGAKVKANKVSTIDMDMDLQSDTAYAYRLPPQLVHVDPEATRYEDLRWVAQEYYQPFDMVKQDPFLKKVDDASRLIYGRDSETPSIFTREEDASREREWVRIFEIWDREDQVVRVLCDGCKDFNRTVEGFPYQGIRGFPFKYLTITEAVDKFYPPSPILAWLPMVNELGFIRGMRMDHMRKMVTKIISETNNFDPENLERLKDPETEYAECQDINRVKDFKGLTPDANLYASEEQIESTIRDISGFSELISGSVPYSKLTATTSTIAAQHSTIRFQHATQIVSEFVKECATDLFMIIRDYQEYPITVRNSDDPRANLKEISEAQLRGEFDFRVLVEDMSHVSKAERVKSAYDELIALAPFKQVKQEALIRKFLHANGHMNIDEFMHPPMGPPMDPMFENSLMSKGIPVRVNPNEDFELHLRVHNEWISSPGYQQIVAQFPGIHQMVSAHIQQTTRAFEEQQQQQGARAQPGVTANSQQGRQLVTSTPQGGAQNQQGPADMQGIMQAMAGRGGM